MGATTTIEVRGSTRALLVELATSRRQSVDEVLRTALAALTPDRRDDRRRLTALEARASEDDPADRAEVRAIRGA